MHSIWWQRNGGLVIGLILVGAMVLMGVCVALD